MDEMNIFPEELITIIGSYLPRYSSHLFSPKHITYSDECVQYSYRQYPSDKEISLKKEVFPLFEYEKNDIKTLDRLFDHSSVFNCALYEKCTFGLCEHEKITREVHIKLYPLIQNK